ncbi:hypothetical protein ABH007_06955 [Bacteroides thetaiotaomicron]|jgi:hypothetical protein|uniref:hypothetical protein n=1 Tax=Bacteroides thetaiotaomicron TaxID=818 RepID=UPI00232C5B76|nr:hypothetical protein [Bacteroides thetaiotaomicron]MDC2012230.1 hypothetical protein [Bacteroides thetaiotaomicron]MDC2016220.1 hypothetical protein [Bacteroides thetaiotaomicron]MDC2034282.1 hypothetical protein [Bacteroides thetaiotaomicron]MDC2039049.1 hypothetical protein [Bacteroides thetaiotaomicron]MDC2043542.1 hypothetical protein [Bacteroides thetaiotaomicron]
MADNQEVIDKLIDYIDQAILKNSVSNRDVAAVLSFLNERYKNMSGSGGSLTKDIRVTAPQTGYIKPGDVLKQGTTYESLFRTMLSHAESASLVGHLSTSNDVEYGTAKGQITYIASRYGNGEMIKAYYDYNEAFKMEFSAESNGEQRAVRVLDGYYTQGETYAATVVYAASADNAIPQQTLNNKISVNVKRKWFAGVCDSVPTTSAEVRALSGSGLYKGSGSYKFTIGNYKTFVICIPNGTIKDVSLERYQYNFMDLDSAATTRKISVAGANGSAAIEYTMYVFSTATVSTETDNFTFKTN